MFPALLAALLLAASPAAGEPAHVGYPSSIVALGHSGSTGFNSDSPGRDAKQNSWSAGANPAVKSHYLRILSANPKIRGHNLNFARDGATMRDLLGQASAAATQKPDYVTVEFGGNDFCGRSDTPLVTFRAELIAGLRELARGAPNARVLVVGMGSFAPVIAVLKTVPEARDSYTDGGPCDPHFDSRGEPDPARVALVDSKIRAYNNQLAAGCSAFIHCRYDNASIDKLPVELGDFSSDWGHPSVQGLAKEAEATWGATVDFTDTAAPVSKASRSGRTVTLAATDSAGVSGIEYRLAAKGAWSRYTKPVTVPKGKTLTWRAVDVNGNSEATHSLKG